jgi:CcmD family protein
MSNTTTVIVAYVLTYVVLGGYALSLIRRRRRLERLLRERES